MYLDYFIIIYYNFILFSLFEWYEIYIYTYTYILVVNWAYEETWS